VRILARKYFRVIARSHKSALKKARKKAGENWVVGDVRLMSFNRAFKKGKRKWSVVAHKRQFLVK